MIQTSDPLPVDALLTIEGLRTHFFLDEGVVRAVDGVDLVVPRGKTLGVVGESGCGKSVTAYSILQLIQPPGRIVGGRVRLARADAPPLTLTDLPADGPAMRVVRGREIAMIFQEPMTSFSPVHTVGSQILEAIRLHTCLNARDARTRAVAVMSRVGIPDAVRRFHQYPHEMSGGLRQRAMIAMALSCAPALLIADEPTTALDVTIQAQILALMRELQRESGMSILLITHDLGVVAQAADVVAVMYLGRVVEHGTVAQIFATPQHPYTRALLLSVPGMQAARKTPLAVIRGTLPDPLAVSTGCPFFPRCNEGVAGLCDTGERPPLLEMQSGCNVACSVRQREAQHLQTVEDNEMPQVRIEETHAVSVVNADGQIDLTDEQLQSSPSAVMLGAPIRLHKGNSEYGEAHIETQRGEKVRSKYGYPDARTMVRDIAERFNQLWYQPPNANRGERLVLVKKNGQGYAAAVEFRENEHETYYSVISAFDTDEKYMKRAGRVLLWDGSIPTSGRPAQPPLIHTSLEPGPVEGIRRSGQNNTASNIPQTLENVTGHTDQMQSEIVSEFPGSEE